MRTTHGHAVSSALRSGCSGACVTHACARACVRSCKRVCTTTRIHACKRSCMRMCGGNTRTCEQPPAAAGHPLGAKTGDRGRARLSGPLLLQQLGPGRPRPEGRKEGSAVHDRGCVRKGAGGQSGGGGGRRTEASRRKSDRRTGSGHTDFFDASDPNEAKAGESRGGETRRRGRRRPAAAGAFSTPRSRGGRAEGLTSRPPRLRCLRKRWRRSGSPRPRTDARTGRTAVPRCLGKCVSLRKKERRGRHGAKRGECRAGKSGASEQRRDGDPASSSSPDTKRHPLAPNPRQSLAT